FVGLGLGFTFAALPGLIIASVPQGETSSAMSFYQVTRYVGFSIGSGLAVTFVRAFDHDAAVPTGDAYAKTFVIGAAICLVAAVAAWALTGDLGAAAGEDDARVVEEGEVGAAGLPLLEED